MTVIQSARDLHASPRKVCVAIGVFDGVHLGHQQVIRQTIADAQQHGAVSVAITFDRHPNAVVAPDRNPPLIYSLLQKLRVIASLGIDATFLINFDQNFSRISGEQFIRDLVRDFGQIHSICVGSNFTFGYKRGGNVALLKNLGQELKFTVHGLAAVSLDGQSVSSTRIREAIVRGDLDGASQMLGRPYSVAGLVMHGDQLGRQLGFPTANLDLGQRVLPANGVYAVQAQVLERSTPDNQILRSAGPIYSAALNLGVRPTLSDREPQFRAEVHLIDFDGDLYGRELELTFVEKLRDEMRFPGLEDLKAQIMRDIASARQILAS
jgi:riboflavin kinase / FMN adenylyltransferase